jgi:CSLREA domain-containing protein
MTALVVGVALALTRGRAAAATTITVTTFADELNSDGDCSLREAVRAANLNTAVDACPAGSSAGADTIVVPAGTYTLTRSGSDNTAAYGDLDITQPLTIAGAGADTTILKLGSGLSDRLVHVLTTTVQISGVTIRNGNSASSGGGLYNQGGTVTLANSVVFSNTASGGNGGGGLHNTGVLTLTNTSVLSNTAASGKDGGGVSNGSGGTLVITGSVLSGNKAGDDGGGVYVNSGVLTMTNTTLSGNSADDNGGGLYNTNGATSWLNNVTASNNTADANGDGGGNGGGLHRSTGTLNIKNTLSAGNFDNSASTKHPDCSGTVTSQGYNLIQSTTGCTLSGDTTGNITGQSANLGPLQNNGGPTLTHALLSGSPAMDAGTNSGCPATDQRGAARPQDGDGNGSAVCDIGAYEAAAPTPTPTSTSTATPIPTDTATSTATPTLALPTDTPLPTGYPLSTPTPAPTVSSQGSFRIYLPLGMKNFQSPPLPTFSYYVQDPSILDSLGTEVGQLVLTQAITDHVVVLAFGSPAISGVGTSWGTVLVNRGFVSWGQINNGVQLFVTSWLAQTQNTSHHLRLVIGTNNYPVSNTSNYSSAVTPAHAGAWSVLATYLDVTFTDPRVKIVGGIDAQVAWNTKTTTL